MRRETRTARDYPFAMTKPASGGDKPPLSTVPLLAYCVSLSGIPPLFGYPGAAFALG